MIKLSAGDAVGTCGHDGSTYLFSLASVETGNPPLVKEVRGIWAARQALDKELKYYSLCKVCFASLNPGDEPSRLMRFVFILKEGQDIQQLSYDDSPAFVRQYIDQRF